jgi:hypothetical protein
LLGGVLKDILGTVSVLITAAGFVAVLWQIVSARRQQNFDNRPRVFVRLRKLKVDGELVLALSVQNIGKTPATRVVIDFSTAPKWNHVATVTYPFLQEQGGIRILGPSVEYTYRLGKLDKSLLHWTTTQASVDVSYFVGNKKLNSSQLITLMDATYLMEKS